MLDRGQRAEDLQPRVVGLLEQRPPDPFFLHVHWVEVHDHSHFGCSYGEGVSYFDAAFGELYDHIDSLGLFDDALVVLTSDYGEARYRTDRKGRLKSIHPRAAQRGRPPGPARTRLCRIAGVRCRTCGAVIRGVHLAVDDLRVLDVARYQGAEGDAAGAVAHEIGLGVAGRFG